MFKVIMLNLAKKALLWGAGYLFKYVDKDHDGKLSYYEIECIIEDVREILTKIKRKV